MLYIERVVKSIYDSYELPNSVLQAVQEPMVTVGTLTYNHMPYIEKCIQGVLIQQTTFPIEFIIGEDFSTDGTREIVFEYARKYPEVIRVITADYNVGAEANSLRSLKAFRGKYVALCEGDDYWTDPLKLQKQVDFLEGNLEYVMCHHHCKVNNLIEGIENILPLKGKDFTSDELVASSARIYTSTKLFRNVFNDEENELPLDNLEDNVLNSYLGTFGGCKFLDFINPSVYNIHAGGVWSKLDYKSKRYVELYYKNIIYNYFIRKYLIDKSNDQWVKIRLRVLDDTLRSNWRYLAPNHKIFTINFSYARLFYKGIKFEFYYRPLIDLFKSFIKFISFKH